jgi:23S rRNA pseudouridine955/2504/2580 synthase
MLEYRITDDHAGVRLDKYLRKTLPAVPTSHLFKMIRVKKIRVNGKRAQPDQDLVAGDLVTVRGEEKTLLAPVGERVAPPPPPVDLADLKVLYEDDWLLAMDKPSGMAVHTGSGITGGTAVDLVRAYLGPQAVRNDFAASPAHRLDRDTSGVLLVAKRRPAMVHFTDVFTNHLAKKRYLVLVQGALPKKKGLIDLALPEHQQTAESRARRGVNLQEARTRYEVERQTEEAAYLSCVIETGRTHQIRRHFTAIGHPVAGDPKHGDFAFNRQARARWGLKRLFLHAARLEFPHPSDGHRVVVETPLPDELVQVLAKAALAAPEAPAP